MTRGARLALALALLSPSVAQAWVREHVNPSDPTTPCLFWARRTVPYQLSSRGSVNAGTTPVFAALNAAFAAWTNVDCSDFTYANEGLTTATVIGFNQALLNQPFLAGDVTPENTVIFRSQSCDGVAPADDPCFQSANDDCSSVYDCWPYGPGIIALTTTTYDSETGSIFTGNVELDEFSAANPGGFYFTTIVQGDAGVCFDQTEYPYDAGCASMDLENTVTHESGHLLGLGHTSVTTATMYPSAPLGQTSKRILAPDDIAGMCGIYPSGQPVVTCNEAPPPTGGCSCGVIDTGMASLLAVLAFAGRRARRR